MDVTELKNLLQRLKGELESGQPVAPELKALLQDLDRDIQQALASEQSVGSTPPGEDDDSLNARAQVIEARFAADHPYLASTLRDMLDTLGKMGI